MVRVTFRFVRPNSFFGRVIAWRLCEPYSHAVVIIGNTAYSSTFPKVVALPASHRTVAMPPRKGVDMSLDVDDDVARLLEDWCKSQLGLFYDFLSIFGWALFNRRVENHNTSYCYEFCHEALVRAGLLTPTEDMISAERLMLDLYRVGARDVPVVAAVTVNLPTA
jgi:hypothetical protein